MNLRLTPPRLFLVSLVSFVAVMIVGCGVPKVYTARGTVTIGGKPANHVRVYFHSSHASKDRRPSQVGMGITDSEGRFFITSGGGEGVERGTYYVTFSRVTSEGRVLTPEERRDDASESIPLPFCNHDEPHTSGMTATVDGQQEFTFSLPK